jgi:peptidoglycan hydrolase CwlO-like protein
MQKILIIAAVVFSLAAAGIGYLNRTKFIEERTLRETTQQELKSVKSTLGKTQVDLKQANDRIAALNADLEKKSLEITDLNASLSKARNDISDLQKQAADKDAQLAQQKTDMTAKDERIALLESKLSDSDAPLKAKIDELNKQIGEKDILTASIQAKLKDTESQLAEAHQQEADRRKKLMRPGLEGKILAVNGSWNFVVLGLGDRNGIVNGAELLIKRGGQFIGKVRITSVEPSTSIADIVANSLRPGATAQPGDTVIYGGPSEDQESK